MKNIRLIIERKHYRENDYSEEENHGIKENNSSLDFLSENIDAMKEYNDYVKKHGNHFTDELSKWASDRMENAKGEDGHHWSVEQVKSVFEKLGYQKPEENTWGDVAYSANMHYADYFGITLKTEAECIKQAYADLTDPDGYSGKIFNRWISDVIGKKIYIPWSTFV